MTARPPVFLKKRRLQLRRLVDEAIAGFFFFFRFSPAQEQNTSKPCFFSLFCHKEAEHGLNLADIEWFLAVVRES